MWSYNYTYPNYLAHYGVLGMKWGVRKKSYSQAESNYRSAKKAKKQAYKNSTEYKTKRSNTLKTAAKVGAAVLGTALAAYGGYKAANIAKKQTSKVLTDRGREETERMIDELFDTGPKLVPTLAYSKNRGVSESLTDREETERMIDELFEPNRFFRV